MRYLKTNTIMLILSTLFLSGCTIKEDRTGCPCRLTIDISDGMRFHAKQLDIMIGSETDSEVKESPDPGEYISGYTTSVSRGLKHLSAIFGQKECLLKERSLIAKEQKEFDPVFLHASIIDCTGETAIEKVLLRKVFAEIIIEMVDESNSQYPFSLSAICQSNGININTMRPVQGIMSIPIESESQRANGNISYQKIDTTGRSNRLFRFICPRQAAHDMTIDISDDKGGLIDRVPLGKILQSAGYNWTSEDLADAFVRINKENIGLSVTINDWKAGEIKEFIL